MSHFKIVLMFFLYLASPLIWAQSPTQTQALQKRLEDLEKQVQTLTNELTWIQSEKAERPISNESFHGLGLGASKVYNTSSLLSVGGYGEIIYSNPRGSKTESTTDVLRLVPYLGYRFTDKLIFNSEIEIQHAGVQGDASQGAVGVTFAYLDFLLHPTFNLRAGHILVPLGLTNLNHEPTAFPSVLRPEVERYLIPSSWHENGILSFGEFHNFHYQWGMVNGVQVNDSLKSSSWIREGRQNGQNAMADHWASVVRLDSYHFEPLIFGASYYQGKVSQSLPSAEDPQLRLWEAHTQLDLYGFQIKALYTNGSLSETDRIATTFGTQASLGERVQGYYTSLGYDIMGLLQPGSAATLTVFVRWSEYDLNKKPTQGQSRDLFLQKSLATYGIAYKPHPHVIVKMDYQSRQNKKENEDDVFNAGLGFIF